MTLEKRGGLNNAIHYQRVSSFTPSRAQLTPHTESGTLRRLITSSALGICSCIRRKTISRPQPVDRPPDFSCGKKARGWLMAPGWAALLVSHHTFRDPSAKATVLRISQAVIDMQPFFDELGSSNLGCLRAGKIFKDQICSAWRCLAMQAKAGMRHDNWIACCAWKPVVHISCVTPGLRFL